jgi:hypothetical protein
MRASASLRLLAPQQPELPRWKMLAIVASVLGICAAYYARSQKSYEPSGDTDAVRNVPFFATCPALYFAWTVNYVQDCSSDLGGDVLFHP